jgi:hypothetical protein
VSDLITRTARLVPYAKRPKQVPSFVTAYSYEPLPNDAGAELGSLYVVMEVLVSGRASEEVADLIIETAGERYYNDPQPSPDPLTRFEHAIKAVNQELGEHVNRGNAAWIGKLSAVIAVQVGADLHVAQTGSAEAFLYRGKSSTHITPPNPNRPATPAKTFGSIASGQLEPSDRLLLATPALIHQIALGQLRSLIAESSPPVAIAEITKLLQGAATDRIAGLVIEVTTPELAALQVRSEAPDEIQLGVPETPLEAAKMAATPIAHTTVASSKRVANLAQSGLKRAQPHARAASLALAGYVRRTLSTKAGRRRSLIGAAIFLATMTGFIWYQSQVAATAKAFGQYQQIYARFQQGEQLLDLGSKQEAREIFSKVQKDLASYKPRERSINNQLQHNNLPETEPRSFAAFTSLVSDRLDQIDNLAKSNVTTVAAITSKHANLTNFQLIGNTAYVIDSGNGNSLNIVNLTTGTVKVSTADTSKLGNVVSTTISGNNDGLYLLTTKPSIWFYRFDTDTLTEQPIAYGQWPAATAVASYTSNLYLLGADKIYKHTKNATGFSPKTEYLSLNTNETTQGSTALAVDGAIYILSPTGLHRYLGTSLKQSAPVPDTIVGATDLRISPAGSLIIATNARTNRLALWSFKNDTLAFSKQVALNGVNHVIATSYDQKSGYLYALADNRIVRISLQP